MFDNEGPEVVSAICNLTSRMFDHLEITSSMDLDQRIFTCIASWEEQRLKNTRCYWCSTRSWQMISRETSGPSAIWRRYIQRDSGPGLRVAGLKKNGDAYLWFEFFSYFEKELWLESGKCMWSNHRIVFQDKLKYIPNDITKPFHVGILRYYEWVQEMHDLAN